MQSTRHYAPETKGAPPKEREDMGNRNQEGYADPTASSAIRNATREEKKVTALISVIKDIAGLAGYEIVGRIELMDKASGRKYK